MNNNNNNNDKNNITLNTAGCHTNLCGYTNEAGAAANTIAAAAAAEFERSIITD